MGGLGGPAVGHAVFLVPSMSTLAPWAGSCPIQSHGTAAFNTPNTGSRHGLSAGGDPTSSSPLRPLTEVGTSSSCWDGYRSGILHFI